MGRVVAQGKEAAVEAGAEEVAEAEAVRAVAEGVEARAGQLVMGAEGAAVMEVEASQRAMEEAAVQATAMATAMLRPAEMRRQGAM